MRIKEGARWDLGHSHMGCWEGCVEWFGIDMFDPSTFDFGIFVGFDFDHWARKGVKVPRVSVRGGSCIQYILGSQGSGSAPEPERSERVSASRHPTLTRWIDPEDGMVYIDVPTYPPPAPPAQTPPSPE
nr:hypothetical protein [Tanacetum cinerariifolium]